MIRSPLTSRRRGRPRRPLLRVELLEVRNVLSAPGDPLLLPPEPQPDDTLDLAANLGLLAPGAGLVVDSVIGDSPAGAADVDWYRFTLDNPAGLTLRVVTPDGPDPAPVVVSLYNADPFNFTDPYTRLGHRLLAQDDAAGDNVVRLDRALAAGTYYVAVSGAGNHAFHPFLADSGYDGSTGAYRLQADAADLGLDPFAAPVVLFADPAPDAVLDRSPLYVRLSLSGPLDVDLTPLEQVVRLAWSADGAFDGAEIDVPIASYQFSPATNEILLLPEAPLVRGYYQLSLTFAPGGGEFDPPPDGGLGPDWIMTFQVAGLEGDTDPDAVPDDTAAGAHDLGDVTTTGPVQVAGQIGDDSTRDHIPDEPELPIDLPFIWPGADVDLYHFRVTGPGRFTLTAEVFAQRIGSPLDPGLSLFRYDPDLDTLVLVAGNRNTDNSIQPTSGFGFPVRLDPALFAGLIEGDYYLAVSSGMNVPDPLLGVEPGEETILGTVFDPNVSHSGTAGISTGPYLLNLLVQPENDPPQVVSVTPGPDADLDAPPTLLEVQFTRPANLQQLAYQAFLQSSHGELAAVYVEAGDGSRYHPRFVSFDMATNRATLLLLDALPDGEYTLHLSGPLGLADLAGNPLVGNDPGGDYVVRFQVHGPARGTAGDPLTWIYQPTGAGPVQEQTLGTLFPLELETGVRIVRDLAPAPETADVYVFEVLQAQKYLFFLGGDDLPAGVTLALFDANGDPVPTAVQGPAVQAFLQPGVYRVVLAGWSTGTAVGYEVLLRLAGQADSPVPLTSGPAPAIRLRLLSHTTPLPPPPPPPPSGGTDTPPPGNPPGTGTTPPVPASNSLPPVQSSAGGPAPLVQTAATSSPPRLDIPIGDDPPSRVVPAVFLVSTGETSSQPVSPAGPQTVTFFGITAAPLAAPDAVGGALPTGGSGPFGGALALLPALGAIPGGSPAVGTVSVPAAPRLELQFPDTVVAEGVIHALILTPVVGVGGDEAPPPTFWSSGATYRGTLVSGDTTEPTNVLVFGLTAWWSWDPIGTDGAPGKPGEAPTVDAEDEEHKEPMPPEEGQASAAPSRLSDLAWLQALGVLWGAALPVREERRRRAWGRG